MLLPSIFLLLLPIWSLYALAATIPQPLRDLVSEQKPVAEQSSLSTHSPTANIAIATSQIPEPDHKHPIRNGDPYGLSDFGIDPAHVTSEQMQSLREAGMIRDLEDR